MTLKHNTGHSTFTTHRNNTPVVVNFLHVSHIIRDEKQGGSWIWFISGKSIHVTEGFDSAHSEFSTFIENY